MSSSEGSFAWLDLSHIISLFSCPLQKNIPQNCSAGIFGRADALTELHVTASSPFTNRRTKKQNRKATLLLSKNTTSCKQPTQQFSSLFMNEVKILIILYIIIV
jgi:hypothetical protein